MTLEVTIALMASGVAAFLYALWQEKRPPRLGKPPLIAPPVLQLLSIIFVLIMAGHLVSLLTGTPFEPRSFRGGPGL